MRRSAWRGFRRSCPKGVSPWEPAPGYVLWSFVVELTCVAPLPAILLRASVPAWPSYGGIVYRRISCRVGARRVGYKRFPSAGYRTGANVTAGASQSHEKAVATVRGGTRLQWENRRSFARSRRRSHLRLRSTGRGKHHSVSLFSDGGEPLGGSSGAGCFPGRNASSTPPRFRRIA
uniref:Uncharacterized protein TCIL3000_11_4160 n=1 Tax=Trypanosoma congolense (strain IL3000) TaxID=1068625 RepID=G0V041_TRYCI|nr:unnamed protein product [Trypanosoma congolense IL3000]